MTKQNNTAKASGKKNSRKGNAPRRGTKERRSKNTVEMQGVVSLTRDGLGFVEVEGQDEDIMVRPHRLRGALGGDTVAVAVNSHRTGARREGEVVRIVERSAKPHIGVLAVRGRQVWAIVESARMPYDIRIPLQEGEELPTIGGIKAKNGTKVAVLVTDWPRKSPEPLGKIVDVLGTPGENNTEMHAILAEYCLPYRFEEEVEKAAAKIPTKITKAEIARRKDYRKVFTFTIDPADAKDFDDALSFIRLDGGRYEVGVHIADVSHYVRPGDVVDKEAYSRATSVYLVDRTIPMLPEVLSNNLCSLRPGEEKLCYSAVFTMDEKANVLDTWIGRTVIKSDYRFNYDQAQQIIEGGDSPVKDEMLTLWSLAEKLRKKRFAKGAINFDRPEMKVEVDAEGRPVNVYQKIGRECNFLVEEFMLLANRGVAEFVSKKCGYKKPTFVYRIHEAPNADKLGSLRTFAGNLGYNMGPTENIKQTSKSLNTLLGEVKGKAGEAAIEMLALRSMARARYSTDNVGHYGLAFPYYTHFTSPIRRYPDMMVHRLLTEYLEAYNAGTKLSKLPDKATYETWCTYSSDRERIASDAERASIKYKLTEYMQPRIGQEFEGTISGLTEWGMYVEIEPTKIEGMVSLKAIKEDYFAFDEEKYRVTGKNSGRVFTLGDKVRIRVIRASLEQKQIDYELILGDIS